MRNRYPIIAALAIILTLLAACAKKESTSVSLPELIQAETIMYEHPDSALHILQRMQMPDASQKLEHATWALLTAQARYKRYIKQSDSLINIAYDYFMGQGNDQRKALVLYIKGGICNENQEIEEAQKYFLEAANYADKGDDHALAYMINLHLGDLYVYRKNNSYAMQAFEQAYQYSLKLDRKFTANLLIRIARTYANQEKYDKAIEIYNKAINLAKELNESSLPIHCMHEIATIYTRTKDYKSALINIKEAILSMKKEKRKVPEQFYLTLGDLYRHTGPADSAYHYLNKALKSDNIYTLCSAYQALYYLSQDEQNYKDAVAYSVKFWNYQDSIQKIDKSKALIEMQEKYNQQKLINEKNLLKIQNDRNTRNTLIAITLLLAAIAMLIYIYQQKLRKKERTIQKKEEEIRSNTMKINENEFLIKRNLARMEELMVQIKANNDIQEQLEELNKTYTEIQQQNDALTEENRMLQSNIDQYTASLHAQSEELKKLHELTEESQRLHDREKMLCTQLVKNNRILNSLTTAPKYLDAVLWQEMEEAVNLIFDNFTSRLLKKIPTLTEYELHLCCLIKLRMSNANIATTLGISPASVSKQKYRLKERIMQKTQLSEGSSALDLWLWDF